jgi:hypothetical protein
MNIKNILFWLATITLSFIVGYFSNTSQQIESNKKTSKIQLNEAESVENNKAKAVRLTPENIETKDESVPLSDVSSIMTEVKSLLGDSVYMMDLSSIAKSYALIQTFSELEVSEALGELQGSLNDTKNMMVVNLLIGRYAEMNPYNAIDFIENNVTSALAKNQTLSTAIKSWSKSDPTSAYYWTKENDQEQGDFMSAYKYVSVFNGLAKQDINDAFSKLNEMADKGQSTNMAAMGVANVLENGEQFTTFYENSKKLGNDSVMNTAITSWVNKDPQVVTSWLDGVEAGKDKTTMKNNVLNNWLMSEPTRAADWYMNESNGDNRQASADQIVRSWGVTNPQKALKWINDQSDINDETTIKNLLQSSTYSNSQFVIDNLSLLDNEDNKKSISRQVYNSLKRSNKKKAELFLNDSAYKEHILQKK